MKLIMVIILNFFAYLTIVLRPKIYDVDLFKPMIWNFKLSILSIFLLLMDMLILIFFSIISTQLNIKIIGYIGNILTVLGLFVWLLVLPNSNYLITELNLTHRDMDRNEVPIWYDIVSIMSFALSGIMNTVININLIQYYYLLLADPVGMGRKDKVFFYLSTVIINLLISLGVYLGRNIRFNSWDILHPIKFIKKLFDHFTDKSILKNFILFIIFHTSFFIIVFFILNTNNIFLWY